MPEPGKERQWVTRPWENGRDEREKVCQVLVEQVAEEKSLQPAVVDGIRHRLERDNSVYRQGSDEEQAYLLARDRFLAEVRREPVKRVGRITGYALMATSGYFASTLLFTLFQRLILLFNSPWWQGKRHHTGRGPVDHVLRVVAGKEDQPPNSPTRLGRHRGHRGRQHGMVLCTK